MANTSIQLKESNKKIISQIALDRDFKTQNEVIEYLLEYAGYLDLNIDVYDPIKEFAILIEAYKNNKVILCSDIGDNIWEVAETPIWDFDNFKYKVEKN